MRQSTTALLLLSLGAPVTAWLRHSFLKSPAKEPWTVPKETIIAESEREQQIARGWTPKPTAAPRLQGRMQLQAREDYTLGPGTCGFVSGKVISGTGESYTCIDTAATCTYSDAYIGCCRPNEDCDTVKTTCIDYNGVEDGECIRPDSFHTLCCTNSYRGSCHTHLFSYTDNEDQTYSYLDCSATAGTDTLLDYDPGWALTRVHDDQSETTSDIETPTDTGFEEQDGGGDSTNVGAIAGGTVGGVAALALVGVAFFLLRRQKKKYAAVNHNGQPPPMSHSGADQRPEPVGPSSAGMTSTSAASGVYPSGVPSNFQGYPPQHGAYDPHVGIYSQQGYPQYNQGYQQPQQQFGAMGYQQSSSTAGSPPPNTSPSPGMGKDSQTSSPQPQVQQPSGRARELQTVNPVVMESNRAELGS